MRDVSLAVATSVAIALATPSTAGAIEVSPVTIELAPGQMATTLTLANRESRTITVQLRAFAWDQAGGEDNLAPTRELAIGPPFVNLQTGETQLVRLVLRRRPVDKELSYRVLLDQLPPPESPDSVRVLLRVSLPVFAEPDRRVASALEWRILVAPNGALELVGANKGQRRSHVRELTVAAPGVKRLTVASNGAAYILPGAERRWRLEGDVADAKMRGAVQLTGLSDEGRISAFPTVVQP